MKKGMPEWELIEIGASLGELAKRPDIKQIFMFSAITWNRHVIHYNRESARNEGLPDIVVQRALIGNFFAQFLERWMEDKGDIMRLEWKVVHSAVPGDTLTCRGVVREKYAEEETRLIRCDLEVVNQNAETIAQGQAMLRLFDE